MAVLVAKGSDEPDVVDELVNDWLESYDRWLLNSSAADILKARIREMLKNLGVADL